MLTFQTQKELNMLRNILEGVEEIDWEEARKSACHGDQELFKILEEINPGQDLTFIRVKYPFGSVIMGKDQMYLPIDGSNKTEPLSHPNIPQALKEKLGYRSIPFGMITYNQVEVFRETDDRVFSVELSAPNKGIELGIFEFFKLTPCYTVTSGARSLFMIPKISQAIQHKRLAKIYEINIGKPKNILKHWYIFKELCNSPNFQAEWHSEVIYLTKAWDDGITKNKGSPVWDKLLSYLYKKGFEHSSLGRSKLVLDMLWQRIAGYLNDQGSKPDPYTIDTLKHLIYVFVGTISGSRPAINNYAGPIIEIQKAYVEAYGLKEIPTIMHPCRFSIDKNTPVYYSMQVPMMTPSTPNFRKMNTIVEEMRQLETIKERQLDAI